MKRIIFGVLSFLSVITYAQNQRFSYEYKFVKDSTAKDKSVSELMYLDVSRKGSKFYSRDRAVADSIFLDMYTKGNHNVDLTGMKFGEVPYTVEKSYPDYEILFFNKIDMDEFKVSDNRKLTWKILPDKEKIGEFNAQKATANFAGRQWIAWFSTEIPFQDGPYKFSGLPGLIVKIQDQTNSHHFMLKEVKKLKAEEIWISENQKTRYQPLIALSQDKYKKQFVDYRNNPTKGVRQLIARGGSMKYKDQNGKELDTNEHLRNQEKRAKENNARNNNLLELDLLQ
ncbi:hypothetical protein CHRY9390_03007 [Chryseobacterium aquaeductus]|uniref:GLPGLI family protein n=1 Tax=Chryseobacterium aquaeductus TaxID=2675056 RepID=A0A9N8MIY1_9FLAO|nr:GLPGLI family protein [Chryseobacterium aquaeductus]CAA7332285.1 hypothetical protein CHRY9390_03007 [Chryseobacterium potabilaquae]CAD7815634.1 hypothetical protein CHRY9390_03007 [Chryseobacterium aquaeductus]